MNRVFHFFLAIAILFLASCAAKKKAAELESQPGWLKQKPYDEDYYTGVGSALKVGTAHQYKELAKKDALADLASEISVNISSSSVLHTIETQYGNTDLYDQRIEMEAADYLEGFEPVDSYENESHYWTYFRIRKSTYVQNKARRKAKVAALALSKYEAGMEAVHSEKPAEALTFYLQGLEAVKSYLAEEIPVERNGQRKDIGNALFIAMNHVVDGLKLQSETAEVFVQQGSQHMMILKFRALFSDTPVKGIPVRLNYSGGYLKQSQLTTDHEGFVVVDPGVVNSKKDAERITATIHWQEIANQATEDLFIRGLLNKQDPVSASTVIRIAKPTLALEISERFCSETDCRKIQQVFEKNVLQSGFRLESTHAADFLFELQAFFTEGETAGDMTSVYLEGEVLVTTKDGQIAWSKKWEPIKGVGRSAQQAREKAFESLISNLNLISFPQGLDAIQ